MEIILQKSLRNILIYLLLNIERKYKMLFHYFKKIRERFVSSRLMTKLLLSYLLLIIIPLFVSGTVFYKTTSKTLETKTIYSAQQSFEQAYSYLSYKIHNILAQTTSIVTDNNLRSIISKNPLIYSQQPSFLISDTKALITYLQGWEDVNNIARVRLYVNKDLSFSSNRLNIFSFDDITNSIWYKKLAANSSRLIWLPSDYLQGDTTYLMATDNAASNTLSLAMKILNTSDYNKNIGIIRCDFSKPMIESILSNANSVKGSLSYIINSENTIVASSSNKQLPSYNEDYAALNSLSTNWIYQSINNKDSLIGLRQIDNTDWYMITIIPIEQIIQENRQIFNYIFILIAVIGTIAYLTAFFISRSITNRVSRLTEKMNDLRYGKLLPMEPSKVKDEIGLLIDDYNYMTQQMTELIEHKYKMGQEIKSAELKALQAQINPHFLYNTLDMINWYAKQGHSSEILTIISALTKFYRLSLNKGRDIVSIGEELEHVQNYFTIQNFRFQNRLNLIINVPQNILNYQIPKITLQPLVENAILHGIMCKENKSGNIKIAGEIDKDGVITLSVNDDGIGMTSEKLSSLLYNSIPEQTNGFGIKNVDSRLKIYYGNNFGLSYSSEINKGTTVCIKIPANEFIVPSIL